MMRARTRIGLTLRGKWHLDTLLGVGGMAAVYAATHRNGTRAALKILHPELGVHSHVRARFFREGRVANTVGHVGAVKVLDEDEAEDGSLFLVMELLDGESLESRAARHGGQLSVDEVLSAGDQVLDVLIAAHDKGIIHRDLKPENVFLTRAGEVRVLDFGIARLREISTQSQATRDGSTMGTPAFMAPEQARGLWDEVDARADLWAVGATMFTLICGKPVHSGRTTNEVLVAAITQKAPSLCSVAPDTPEPVARLIDRALAFEKDGRWPTAKAMQEALRRAYEAMHRAPISTAPKLTVPPTVTDRTLPSADLDGGASPSAGASDVVGGISPGAVGHRRPLDSAEISAMPVSHGSTGVSLMRTVLDKPWIAAVGVAGAAMTVLLLVILLALAGRSRTVPVSAAASAPAASVVATHHGEARKVVPSSPVADAAASGRPISSVPVVDLEALPTAAPAPAAAVKPLKPAAPAPQTGGTSWKDLRK